jgi:tRNA A-37 threonylcarbamoyl transferase component Bud32
MAQGTVDKRPSPMKLERLGRYRMVRPLSKGGMALVYEARRESLAGVAPRVAIKLILPEHADSDTFRELFKNEARLGANMHHQNLVQIQDFDMVDDHFFLVMEYVEGLNLRQVVSACVRANLEIPVGVIAEVGRQACDGLHDAHEATDERGVHLGLIHRDVKPSNLMLNPHGVVKILDFGISKGNLLTERSGAVRGTWGYMAPEQAFGRGIASNADVFGLATILYEMASRQPLFRKKTPDEIKRLLDDDHAARMAATLPAPYAPLVPVLVRGLQRDPAARYASAADFGRALSALLPDPITARDEVVRFYRVIDAIEQGRPVPAGADLGPVRHLAIPGPGAPTSPTQGSLVAAAPPPVAGRRWLWLGLAATALLVVGLSGAAAGAAWWVRPASSTGTSVLDLDAIGDLGQDFVIRPMAERPPPTPTVRPAEDVADDPPAQGVGTAPAAAPRVEPRPPPIEAPVVVEVDRSVKPPEETPGADPDAVADGGTTADAAGPSDDAGAAAAEGGAGSPDPVTQPRITEVRGGGTASGGAAPPAPAAVGTGWVTLSAQPYGMAYDVFIDGKLVKKAGPTAPVIRHELTAGPHFITISAVGGAQKQFQLDITDQEHVRRVWDFERNAWRR